MKKLSEKLKLYLKEDKRVSPDVKRKLRKHIKELKKENK